MIDPGKLKHRINIQGQSTEQDDFGAPIKDWSSVLTCWASIQAASSKEVYAASGYTSSLSHKIVIRYPSVAITSAMRVVYRDRVYQIQAAIDPDESREELQLMCLQRDNGTE